MSGVVNAGGDYHILNIYCQQLWNVVQLRLSVCPSDTGLGNENFLRYMYLYWIYNANNCGMLFI